MNPSTSNPAFKSPATAPPCGPVGLVNSDSHPRSHRGARRSHSASRERSATIRVNEGWNRTCLHPVQKHASTGRNGLLREPLVRMPSRSTSAEAQAWLDEITAARVTGTYVAPKASVISVG
jgi:hypothetical protein